MKHPIPPGYRWEVFMETWTIKTPEGEPVALRSAPKNLRVADAIASRMAAKAIRHAAGTPDKSVYVDHEPDP